MDFNKCPCGKNKLYKDCCGIIHNNVRLAKTPEDLMRSRYTAFVMADIEFLMQSWHSKTKDSSFKSKKNLFTWSKSVTWVKLDVLNSSMKTPYTGEVEFKAFFYENGSLEYIHENSLFTIENKHWVYVGEA